MRIKQETSKKWVVLLTCFTASVTLAKIAGAQNLLTNPGFEYGNKTGWSHPLCDMRVTTEPVRSGNYSAYVYNRTEGWQGPRQSVLGKLEVGKTYRISAWVRLDNADSDGIGLTVYQEDAAGTIYPHPHWTTGYRDRWVQLSGAFTLSATGNVTGLAVYVEGPAPGVNFYVDDFSVEEIGDWRTEAQDRIERIRKRDAVLTVLGPDDRPAAGAKVRVRQIRNHFAFGSTINKPLLESGGHNPYADFVRDHYEWVVFENEARWYNTEPIQGQVSYADADAMYAWCREHGMKMRGHPMYWAVEEFVPWWVKALNTTDLRAAVENRMEQAMNHFKDKFVHWDINNEMVAGHYYKDRLGENIRIWMYQRAHEIDPDCQLFVNDYNVIAWGDRLEAYMQLIHWLLDNGAPVHGIGVQSHFNAGFDPTGVLERLDQLESLGLPIWVTEFDMAAPNEHVRADNLEDFFRIAFSHPAVHGIIMWGFWENSHWREDCYIVNADWSLNEAGRRYEALRDEWRTETEGTTDASGTVAFRGFNGTYEVTVTFPDHSVTTTTFDLLGASTPLTVQIDHAGNTMPVEIATWQGDKKGACSFTLDDNLRTHVSHFIPKLQDLGLVGTIFLITNDGDLRIVNDHYSLYAGLVDSGWEIGSHSVSHSNLIELDDSSLRRELADSKATLQTLFDLPSELTMSYPFSSSDPRVRDMTAEYYLAARGGQATTIPPDMADWSYEGYDEFNLPSYPWRAGAHDLNAMNSATNRAISRGEWIIEQIHGTERDGWEPPDWASTYEPHFEYVKSRESDLWIDTFGNIYGYIAERSACNLAVQAFPGGTAIVLTNESALPATPVPLTIKIDIPDQWLSVTVTDNGHALSGRIIMENRNKYYLVDTIPTDAPKELHVSGSILSAEKR